MSVKLALFTGLRIEEVLTIPPTAVWDGYLDMITGRRRETAGTTALTLLATALLRRSAHRRRPKSADEAHQRMPAMFEDICRVSTVTEMVEIVGPVRELLRLQQQNWLLSVAGFSYLHSGRPV